MTRTSMLGFAAAAVLTLGLGGWAAAGASQPAPAPVRDGQGPHLLQVRYEVRREAPYLPPPATEATRLDVLSAQAPTVVEDGVLSAQAGDALRSVQAEEAARTAAAMAAIRAEDARIDRETAAAMATERDASVSTSSQPA